MDGYYLDDATGNLYLYQFKYSNDWRQFQGSMRRLIKVGLAKIFSHTPMDVKENVLLQCLRAEIDEFKPKIRTVYIRFVFTGNPERAEESDTLKDLEEQIEERGYLVQECFERNVELKVQFLSTTLKTPPKRREAPVATFPIDIGGEVLVKGPDGEAMHAGFISLRDLLEMFRNMGARLFDRNIRATLARRDGSKTPSVNAKIMETLKLIVIERSLPPSAFSFMPMEQHSIHRG